jgi:hypothetical protein
LASLVRSLNRPSFRKSFVIDPLGTVGRAGLNVEHLPSAQLDILAGLSAQEVEMFAAVAARLREANSGRPVSV